MTPRRKKEPHTPAKETKHWVKARTLYVIDVRLKKEALKPSRAQYNININILEQTQFTEIIYINAIASQWGRYWVRIVYLSEVV